ncbi:MAG: sulfite exporter TauE/SafE family protein [Thermoplasmata archaeon]
MALPETLLLLLLFAVGAGFLGSLAGLGGGVIIVPILVVLFHVPFVLAVGASAVSVLATSTTAGSAYVHDHLTDLRIGMFLEIATVPGALIGATITIYLTKAGLDPYLLIALGAVLLLSIPGSLFGHSDEIQQGVVPDARSRRLRLGGAYQDRRLKREVPYMAARTNPALGVMFGAGLVAGMFGIGSGVLKVLALDGALKLPMKVSSATSNFMIGVTAAAGAGVLLAAGYMNPVIAAPVALGTMAGAFVGSRILPGLSNHLVRLVFLVLMGILAVELILRGLGLQ